MLVTFSRPSFTLVTILNIPCSSVMAPCTKAESGSDSSTTFTYGIGSPLSSITLPPISCFFAIAVIVIIITAIRTVSLKFIFFILFIILFLTF